MKNPFTLMTHHNSQGIFTTMIGFVTWPPFCTIHYLKGGQVTKSIIVVKIPCEQLCVIKVKGFFINNQLNFLALDDIRAFSR